VKARAKLEGKTEWSACLEQAQRKRCWRSEKKKRKMERIRRSSQV